MKTRIGEFVKLGLRPVMLMFAKNRVAGDHRPGGAQVGPRVTRIAKTLS
jgi:hypothetical protein